MMMTNHSSVANSCKLLGGSEGHDRVMFRDESFITRLHATAVARIRVTDRLWAEGGTTCGFRAIFGQPLRAPSL
jgi:hypothetical protein